MARSSRHRSHRADRRSSRDRRGRSDSSDSEEEQEGSSRGRRQRDDPVGRSTRDSESERRKSTPGKLESDKEGPSGLASGESSGERGKKRKERSGDASDAATAAANRWEADTDVAATVLEEKDMKAKEILDAEKSAKPRPLSSESKSKSNKRQDGSNGDRREEVGSRDEPSKRGSEKEPSRRGSGSSQQVDPKESSRDATRDKAREHVKDKDRPSGRERNCGVEMERDNVTEKVKAVEKEERSKRDKERSSNSETKQHSGKGKGVDDKREELNDLTSKTSKLGCTEAGDKITKVTERDCSRPKDSGNTDRKVQDKKNRQEDDMDHADKSSTHTTAFSGNRIHHDRESNDGRHKDKITEDAGRERRLSDSKRPGRSSRDHCSDSFISKQYKHADQTKEKSRLPMIELEDRSRVKDSTKYIDDRGKKRPVVEKDFKTSNANDQHHFDCNDDRSRSNARYSNRVDSTRVIRRSSPSSAIDILRDESRRNPRRLETSYATISKDRQHASSCSSGDIASGSVLIDKAYDFQSVESSSRQKEKVQSTDFPAKESPASQNHSTPKSENHFSAPRSSEKSTSAGDPDKYNRKGAKRSLDVADISYHGSFSSDGREHTVNEEKMRGSFSSRQNPDGNARIQLSNADTTRSSSSLYSRSDPISHGLLSASNRQGLSSPSGKSSVEDDNRFQSNNDRRSNIRHKRTGDSHLGRGQGAAWNGGLPSWPPPFANGFMPFQHAPPGIQPVGQPFASPSLFGVRPFMDFGLSRIPFHIHENPERFSNHGRPPGWGNPSDGPYSCPQGWEGNSGIMNDTSTHRREDMDQAKHLTSNGEWIMDGNKQKRPSAKFIHARKELVASVQAREDNLGPEHRDSQVDSDHDPNRGITQLVDTGSKKEAESLQKAPKSSNSETNSGDTCGFKYLSKLDISRDLAQPELYKHFIRLHGTECQSPCSNLNNKIQGPIACFKMAVQNCNGVDKPLLPVIAGALFKKALSLYNTNGGKPEGEDPIISEAPKLDPFAQSQKGSSEEAVAPVTESLSRCSEMTIEPMKNHLSEMAAAECANSEGAKSDELAECQSEPNAGSHMPHDKTEGNYAAATYGGSSVGKSGGIGFGNDSTARCESLISVCLSRIPNSPESTH